VQALSAQHLPRWAAGRREGVRPAQLCSQVLLVAPQRSKQQQVLVLAVAWPQVLPPQQLCQGPVRPSSMRCASAALCSV
jgi:hypothetical protein